MQRYSILQNKKECYVCGTTENIHTHEVYFGANRQKSIKYGCCVYLCGKHHNLSSDGVHYNHELDIHLKQVMQKKFNEVYSDKDFLKIFGKNYL